MHEHFSGWGSSRTSRDEDLAEDVGFIGHMFYVSSPSP